MTKCKRWTKKEIEFLKNNCKNVLYRDIAKMLGRTKSGVNRRAYLLNLDGKKVMWTNKEVDFLKNNCGVMSYKDIAKKLGRTSNSVNHKAFRLNLVGIVDWTKEEIEFLKKNYKTMLYRDVAKRLGKTYKSVAMKTSRLNLRSNKMNLKTGYSSWNKNKTKGSDERLRKVGKKSSKTKKRRYKEGKIKLSGCAKLSKEDPSWQSGENHPNWLNGISFEPYSPEFNKKLKEQIKKRDNYRCQLCGDFIPKFVSQKRRLDVHHIDYNKKNNNPNNLISLCHFCNNSVNKNREDWTNYFQNKIGG